MYVIPSGDTSQESARPGTGVPSIGLPPASVSKMEPTTWNVRSSLARIGLSVLISPAPPRISDPPCLAAVSMGNAAKSCCWNSARVIDCVQPEAIGVAPGEPTGDAAGEASGVALMTVGLISGAVTAACVLIGIAVGVGSLESLEPPQAANTTATSANTAHNRTPRPKRATIRGIAYSPIQASTPRHTRHGFRQGAHSHSNARSLSPETGS